MIRFRAIFIKDYTYFIALFSFYLPIAYNHDSTADRTLLKMQIHCVRF